MTSFLQNKYLMIFVLVSRAFYGVKFGDINVSSQLFLLQIEFVLNVFCLRVVFVPYINENNSIYLP